MSESETLGSSWAVTEGYEESDSETHTRGWSRSVTDAEQDAVAYSESDSEGFSALSGTSAARGTGRAHSRTASDGMQVGWGMSEGQSWDGAGTDPDAIHYSWDRNAGGARSHATSYGESANDFDMAGESYAGRSRIHSSGTTFSHGTSHAITKGKVRAWHRSYAGYSTSTQEGGSVSQSHGQTHGRGRAVQSGQQGSRSWGASHSISEGGTEPLPRGKQKSLSFHCAYKAPRAACHLKY